MQTQIASLERALQALDAERAQQQERLVGAKELELRLVDDKKLQRKQIDELDGSVRQAEVQRRQLECDLQRVRMAYNEKEAENAALIEKLEGVQRMAQDLEAKAQGLQLTVDRLNGALVKQEEEGALQKDKLQQLNVTLSDSNAAANELQHRLSQMQKALGTHTFLLRV